MRAFAGVSVALLLLLAACGEDEPAFDVPEDFGSTTTGPTGPEDGTGCEGEPAQQLDAVLDVRAQGPVRTGQPVTWVLELEHRGDAAVVLRFGSGQDGDVVLLRGEEEIYRWSEGMLFTQAIRCRTVQAGGRVVFELRGEVLDVEPGDYTLRATLSSEPAPPPAEKPITVEP